MASSDKALEFSPANPTFIVNRIEAYEQLDRYDEAMSDLDYMIRRNPNMLELFFEKGRLFLVKGDTISALNEFDSLVKRDSKNTTIIGARAVVRLMVDDTKGALADYNQAIDLGSKNPSHFMNRGILNYRDKKYMLALADYDRAIELEPRNDQALFNRSLLRSEVGDYDNALLDLNSIITLKPDFTEAIYQRALINAEVGNWEGSIADYGEILKKHPSFVPAYYGRSRGYEMLGKHQQAYLDKEKAFQLMQENRNKPNQKRDTIDTSARIATIDESSIKMRASIFNSESTDNGTTQQGIRGTIQNREVNVINEKNFVLSYYRKNDATLPGHQKHHSALDKFNDNYKFNSKLYLVNDEVSLSEGMINYHFATIEQLSNLIHEYPYNAELYLKRAIELALVQDFASAIEDFSKARFYGDKEMSLAYFYRANVRYKQMEYSVNNHEHNEDLLNLNDPSNKKETTLALTPLDKKYAVDFEMIMRDYDKVIELIPDFSYAWYNRGNMLCIQKDYPVAIQNYTRAIELYPDFGEAYFNRGLTYLYLGEIEKGNSDLSKAGELGMYQAYSILKKISNQ